MVGHGGDGGLMEPFLGSVAVRGGQLSRRALARGHQALYRDVYVPNDVELTAQIRAHAAWLATGAPLCGVSAAAALGTKWIDPSTPVQILRADRHAPPGITVHTWSVAPDEVCIWGGVDTTTPARTAFDLGRTLPERHAIPMVDALMNATRVSVAEVLAVADAHPGVRGSARLRKVLALIDGGAESPQETRLRLILIRGGLPRPETQIEFRDLRIRVDMGWPDWKVAVEYDGAQHWTDRRQRSWDIDRIALLEEAGWVVIRVSAEMLGRPDVLVERIRSRLRAAGCPV